MLHEPPRILSPHHLTHAVVGWPAGAAPCRNPVIGVLPGEGIGPEVMNAALRVLEAAGARESFSYSLRTGGKIGNESIRACGKALSDEVVEFCEAIFAEGGAILAGPGGGRFVYDVRVRFGLYCKLSPIWPSPSLDDTGVIRHRARTGIDLVIVRENMAGLYLGRWSTRTDPAVGDIATHEFEYREDQVARVIDVGVALAKARRGKLCVVLKESGMPSMSKLWLETLEERSAGHGLDTRVLEIDNAVYQVIADAANLDVVVASNMLGDIVGDCAALLLTSRGMSFSGNFGAPGVAVYQTAHGAAYDLLGAGTANPIGQIYSVSMMLRESFGLVAAAEAIEAAVERVLAKGWRTPDIASPSCQIIGTREMGERIADALTSEETTAGRTG